MNNLIMGVEIQGKVIEVFQRETGFTVKDNFSGKSSDDIVYINSSAATEELSKRLEEVQ